MQAFILLNVLLTLFRDSLKTWSPGGDGNIWTGTSLSALNWVKNWLSSFNRGGSVSGLRWNYLKCEPNQIHSLSVTWPKELLRGGNDRERTALTFLSRIDPSGHKFPSIQPLKSLRSSQNSGHMHVAWPCLKAKVEMASLTASSWICLTALMSESWLETFLLLEVFFYPLCRDVSV